MSLSQSPLNSIAISALYEASRTKLGITVLTNDPHRAMNLLHKVKAELGDATLRNINPRFSPTSPDNEIWLKKTIEAEPIETESENE